MSLVWLHERDAMRILMIGLALAAVGVFGMLVYGVFKPTLEGTGEYVETIHVTRLNLATGEITHFLVREDEY